MSNPSLTIGLSTGQADYCLKAYPNIHIFEYTMAALRKQTVKDFEVIVADVYYENRKNYFKEHPEDFPILHVPVKPNIWLKNNCPAICATKNTYLMYASGKYVTNMGDCWSPFNNFVELTLNYMKQYKYVSYKWELKLGEETTHKDHRDNSIEKIIHGNVTMSLDDWISINGYNEMFDGAKGLEDCDISFRLNTKDGDLNGLSIVEPYLIRQRHNYFPLVNDCIIRSNKCVGLMFDLSRIRDKMGIYKANTYPLSSLELNYLRRCANKEYPHICHRLKTPCSFFKNKLLYIGNNEELLQLNNHPSLYFDLAEQRKDPERAIALLKEKIK